MNLSRPRSAIVAASLIAPLALLASTHCYADYVTTSAASCQLYGHPGGGFPEQHPEDYTVLPTSIHNRSTDRTVSVACPVIPASVSGTTVSYYVDGSLANSSINMWCGLSTREFTGTFLAQKAFLITAAGPFDQLVTFTSSEAPSSAYVGLHCDMPPQSLLVGVTAVRSASAALVAVDSRPDAGSRAADLRAFETHVTSIAASFEKEDRDQRWSTDATVLLKSIFDQPNMEAVKLTSADCRTTTCRVEIDHDGTPESSALLERVGLQMAGTISSVVAQQLPASGKRSRVALYLSRVEKN
jgi:hypothetical protein